MNNPAIPIIDIAPLRTADDADVAQEMSAACRESGFFYATGHGVDPNLIGQLDELSRRFFAQSEEKKLEIRMELAGRAWRGYFPVGAELTSGKPDQKEGIYFGAELADDDPKVCAGVPLHGRNLFPDDAGFRETVLAYIDALTDLGHTLMRGIALSLGLEGSHFDERLTGDPFVLFRIFNYPSLASRGTDSEWSVGEHTDYGLLTILLQDSSGGLQVKSGSHWIDAPPIADSFVCNIGDMLDRMTGGRYRSTPHRVRNVSSGDRLSFPFFFDPSFDAEVRAIEGLAVIDDDEDDRWDGVSVHDFQGTYGDYILAKVAKVFPDLRDRT